MRTTALAPRVTPLVSAAIGIILRLASLTALTAWAVALTSCQNAPEAWCGTGAFEAFIKAEQAQKSEYVFCDNSKTPDLKFVISVHIDGVYERREATFLFRRKFPGETVSFLKLGSSLMRQPVASEQSWHIAELEIRGEDLLASFNVQWDRGDRTGTYGLSFPIHYHRDFEMHEGGATITGIWVTLEPNQAPEP